MAECTKCGEAFDPNLTSTSQNNMHAVCDGDAAWKCTVAIVKEISAWMGSEPNKYPGVTLDSIVVHHVRKFGNGDDDLLMSIGAAIKLIAVKDERIVALEAAARAVVECPLDIKHTEVCLNSGSAICICLTGRLLKAIDALAALTKDAGTGERGTP